MKQKAITLSRPSTNPYKLKKIAIEIIVAILLIVWIYTGISKLFEWYNFRYQLSKWEFFRSYSIIISYAVPIIELLIAGLLIIRRSRIIGLWASFILMFIFTAYVLLILGFAKELPCTCGGILAKLNWTQHLILNIILTLFALIAILFQRRIVRGKIE